MAAKLDGKLKLQQGPPIPTERKVIIATNGSNFRIISSECSLLEIKEMCREILEAFQAKAAGAGQT